MTQTFSDYCRAVDEAMGDLFGIGTDIEQDVMAGAQQDGWTPEQLAACIGKYEGFGILGEPQSPCDCFVCACDSE
jgi:hypothetical protein